MSDSGMVRERQLWMAVVAVLATSVAWLAAIDLALILKEHAAAFSAAGVTLRVLARGGCLVVARLGGPLLAAGLLVAIALAGALRRGGRLGEVRRV